MKKLIYYAAFSFCLGTSLKAEVKELNWENYAEVRDYAKRKTSDLHYLSIPWKDTVQDGLAEGSKKNKPVLLWLYFGDGRGHC